jgi:hypothetical protein
MLNRTLLVACLLAALAACERAEEAPAGGATMQDPVRSTSDKQAISAMPEHFDRVRAEQYEKEEDRLRRRGSRN